jgi:hypothetical protein
MEREELPQALQRRPVGMQDFFPRHAIYQPGQRHAKVCAPSKTLPRKRPALATGATVPSAVPCLPGGGADGIVMREVYPTVPPKVEYSLTDYGRSLKRALKAICDWGKIHMERIAAVQTIGDADRYNESRISKNTRPKVGNTGDARGRAEARRPDRAP